jgi:hypothetical protein
MKLNIDKRLIWFAVYINRSSFIDTNAVITSGT